MDKNYGQFLQRKLNEALQEFEEAKKSAIKDLEGMGAYHAQDWGAAYFTKIDKVTATGTKVQQWQEAMRAYDYFNGQEDR